MQKTNEAIEKIEKYHFCVARTRNEVMGAVIVKKTIGWNRRG
jgi:hypothetical protein